MSLVVIKGKSVVSMGFAELTSLLESCVDIHLDIGTGDGAFLYRRARKKRDIFFVGIEPCIDHLQKYSRKIDRKPAKGGLSNIIYLQGSLETIPEEFKHCFGFIYVNYPWASLLRYFILADPLFIDTLKRIAKNGAFCDVLFNSSVFEDSVLLEKLDLPEIGFEDIEGRLAEIYRELGIRFVEVASFSDDNVPYKTSWGQHLTKNSRRKSIFVRMQIGG